MRLILLFFKRQKDFLVFLLLFIFSFTLVLDRNSFQKSKFLYVATGVMGDVYMLRSGIEGYFNLRQQNELLTQENERLHKELLSVKAKKLEELSQDPILLFSPESYSVYRGEVIKNSYNLSKNYLIIDKGTRDSIHEDMGSIPGLTQQVKDLAYATATTTPDLSHVYNLHHSSRQGRILNPLNEARDHNPNLMDTLWICYL